MSNWVYVAVVSILVGVYCAVMVGLNPVCRPAAELHCEMVGYTDDIRGRRKFFIVPVQVNGFTSLPTETIPAISTIEVRCTEGDLR